MSICKPFLALVVVAGAATTASAEPTVWDRTYKHAGWGGSWPCPDPAHDVVIKDGQFSLPWDAKVGDAPVTIGYFEGSVRPSGLATATVRFLDPLPPAFVTQMRSWNESLGEMRKRVFRVKFNNHPRQPREIELLSDNNCYAYWREDRAALKQQSPVPLDCAKGEYAVAAWTPKRAYRLGETVQLWTQGQPTRVYRCLDACSANVSPTAEGDDYGDDTWALVGECGAGTKPPARAASEPVPDKAALAPLSPPKLPPGSPKWDASYRSNMSSGQDWRCPTSKSLEKLVVSKGSFSIPWKVRTNYGEDDVGVIAGSIKDDGTVTIAATATITALSPELLDTNRKATLVNLRAFVQPTMTFILDVGKMNPKGQGRRTELAFGKDCEFELRASDYKPQQFREEDGWRVSCPRELVWSSKDSYKRGELATIINTDGARRKYECEASTRCDAGVRPDRAGSWRKVGRCE